MKSTLSQNPSQLLLPLLGAAFCLTALGLVFAWTAVARTAGDAEAVNQAGMIRGGIQRAVKMELAGVPALDQVDQAFALLGRLASSAGGMERERELLSSSIARLRSAITEARPGGAAVRTRLLEASEDAWTHSNALVARTEAAARAKRSLFIWGLLAMAGGVLFAGLSVVVSKLFVKDKVEVEAAFDTMTGALRKQRFMERLASAIETSGRDETVGVVMLDLDRFKRINDSYGHDAGDRVLAAVGGALRSLLRQGDAFGRVGGEEFAVALRSKDSRAARLFAERARAAVESLRLERLPIMTISAGAVVARHGEKPLDVLKRADSFLYAAKAAGRNRVRGD